MRGIISSFETVVIKAAHLLQLKSGQPFLLTGLPQSRKVHLSMSNLIYMCLSTPPHSICGGRCPGGQGGNPFQKVNFQKLPSGARNLPGVFAIILGAFW